MEERHRAQPGERRENGGERLCALLVLGVESENNDCVRMKVLEDDKLTKLVELFAGNLRYWRWGKIDVRMS